MNKDEVIALAEKCNLAVFIHSQWTHEIREFTVVDYVVEGDLGSLMQFADLVASAERERIFAEQLQLPEPRLTGKFSITAGKFKCTGCTGIWTNREDAKHHSCKDYQ